MRGTKTASEVSWSMGEGQEERGGQWEERRSEHAWANQSPSPAEPV